MERMSEGMADALADMVKKVSEARDLAAYLVLDHSMSPTEMQTGRDGHGKPYARCSPAVMDTLAKAPKDEPFDPDRIVSKSLTGVPVYKREDLPDEWPNA